MQPTPLHLQYLHRVRRRAALALIAETTAVAIAIASVIAAIDALVAHPSAVAYGLIVVTAICIAGVHCVRRWPSTMAIAGRVDQHMDWHDLLSTAAAIEADPSPFVVAVRAQADLRCAGEVPIPVAQIGSRGWVALVATLGLSLAFVVVPRSTLPWASASAASPTVDPLTASTNFLQAPIVSSDRADTSLPRRTGGDDMAQRSRSSELETTATRSSEADAGRSGDRTPSRGGTGSGAATSPVRATRDIAAQASEGHSKTVGNHAAAGGASASAVTGDDPAKGTTAGITPASTAVPWQRPDWLGTRETADAAIRAGIVPARDRDLVRDYFERAR